MKYIKNIKSSIILNISKILLQFLNTVLLSRSVGAVGQGNVAFFFLVFDLIGTYGNFGITHATTYFYKEKGYKKNYIASVNSTYLLLNGFLLSGSVLIAHMTSSVFENFSWIYIILGCVYFVSVYFYNLFHEILIGDENVSNMNKMLLYSTIAKSVITISLYYFNKLTVDNWLLIQIGINFAMMILLGIQAKVKIVFKWDMNLLKSEFRFGIIVYLSALFGFLNYRIDQFMIKWLMTESDLGVYSIAVTISELAFFIPTCIGAAFSGRLYNVDQEEKKKSLCNTVKFSFLGCIVIVLIGILGSMLIPYVYGKDFAGAILPTMLLLIGVLFASIGKLIYPYYVATGRPVTHMLVAITISIVNVVFNIVLIPSFELFGAAIASVFSYFVYGFIYVCLLKKDEGINVRDLFYISKDDIKKIRQVIIHNGDE